MNVLFRNHDNRTITLSFNTDVTEIEDWIHFYSRTREQFSQLIITAHNIPDNDKVGLFEVECLDKDILCYPVICENERELCDWLRSFFYTLDAYFSYPTKEDT